jgi:hypothetical protein
MTSAKEDAVSKCGKALSMSSIACHSLLQYPAKFSVFMGGFLLPYTPWTLYEVSQDPQKFQKQVGTTDTTFKVNSFDLQA